MTSLEIILAFLVIVETAQISVMLYNIIKMRKTVEMFISDPELMGQIALSTIFGFFDRIKERPDDQERLFGFIATCGMAAWEGVMSRMSAKNPDGTSNSMPSLDFLPKKWRGVLELLNHPIVQGFLKKKGIGGDAVVQDGPADLFTR